VPIVHVAGDMEKTGAQLLQITPLKSAAKYKITLVVTSELETGKSCTQLTGQAAHTLLIYCKPRYSERARVEKQANSEIIAQKCNPALAAHASDPIPSLFSYKNKWFINTEK